VGQRVNFWDTADTLRGAGIKASEWPAYMMPFFALMMLESRLRRFRQSRIEEFKTVVASDFMVEDPAHLQWLDYAAIAANKGYHRDLLIHEKGLRETCAVPGGNFLNRLISHLGQYDPATKRLLGIGYAQGHAKFLDMRRATQASYRHQMAGGNAELSEPQSICHCVRSARSFS
jgi:type I restriction enzyme M protein